MQFIALYKTCFAYTLLSSHSSCTCSWPTQWTMTKLWPMQAVSRVVRNNVARRHGVRPLYMQNWSSLNYLNVMTFTELMTHCKIEAVQWIRTNLPACRPVGIDSIPLVTETLGGLAEDTIHTLRTLGKAIGQRSCSLDPSLATKHLFARFADCSVTRECEYVAALSTHSSSCIGRQFLV